MNDDETRPEALPEPPYSTRLLADLHAGALHPDVADHVRARLHTDPRAQSTLATLDAMTAALRRLRDEEMTMPAEIAERLDATIDRLTDG